MRIKAKLLQFGVSDVPARRWKESSYRVNRIHLPISGEACYRDISDVKPLREGSVYLLTNGFSQDLSMPPSGRYYHLYFDFQAVPPLLTREMQEVRLADDPYLCTLLRAAELLLHPDPAARDDAVPDKSDPIFAEGEQLLRLILMHMEKKGLLSTAQNKKLEAAIGYIEEHFHEPIRNIEIAEALCINERDLVRLFSRNLSISPHQYLTQYRVERATDLLHSGMRVGEAAERCGFQSESAFRIAFKRVTGLAPTARRRAERSRKDTVQPSNE